MNKNQAVVFFLVIVSTTMLIFAYKGNRITEPIITETTTTQEDILRIWPIGDSFTRGTYYSAYGYEKGYRQLLFSKLELNGYTNYTFVGSVRPTTAGQGHDGHGGYPTFALLNGLETWKKEVKDYDIVLLMAGIVDFGLRFNRTVDETYTDLIKIIEFVQNDDTIVLVTAIPQPPLFYWRQSEIETYGQMIENYATTHRNVYFVDNYHDFLNSTNQPDISLFSDDLLHPTMDGYRIISDNFYDCLITNKLIQK